VPDEGLPWTVPAGGGPLLGICKEGLMRIHRWVGCVVLFVGCAHAPAGDAPASADEVAAVRAAITAQNAEFARAFKAKDTAALTHLFTEDAVFLSPSGTIVKGWAELEPLWADRLSKITVLDGGITTQYLDVRGDTAVETSRIGWTFQRADGTQVTRTGRALTVWRRASDGRWRMLADHPEYDPQK
jgi:uncharacterized protein (TIGR02246 family)